MKVSLNGDFSLSSFQCISSSGISSIQCSPSGNDITITGTFSTSSNIGIILGGLTSPKGSTSQQTTISTFATGGYQIDTFSGMVFEAACDLPCK